MAARITPEIRRLLADRKIAKANISRQMILRNSTPLVRA
jgi:hypothetical protein